MNPLQDLKEIYTPTAIDIWPPAYGWWLLAGLVILSLYVLTVCMLKARKNRVVKRQALKALEQIVNLNTDDISQLNQLLKRVAMTYFPKQNVQEMHGHQWTEFLVETLPNKKSKDVLTSFESMQHTLYQPHQSKNAEFPLYCKSVEMWIKHALPPSKKTIKKLEQGHA